MCRSLSLICVLLYLSGSAALNAHNQDMYNLERLTEVRLRPGAVDLRLDFQHREFPGLAVRARMDSNEDGIIDQAEAGQYAIMLRDSLLNNLSVRLEGRELKLSGAEAPRIDFHGMLRPAPRHLDIVIDFSASLNGAESYGKPRRLEIENRNCRPDPGRETFVLIAAREIQVVRTSLDSTASPVDADQLRNLALDFKQLKASEQETAPWRLVLDRWCEYPAANVSAARVSIAPEGMDSAGHDAFQARVNRFFEQGSGGGSAVWLLVLAAFIYGCFHALEPGHAKTITAVYLLGSGQRWPRALLLALTVTLTHTGGVLLLALATSLAWGGAPGQFAQAALTGVSGLIILALGIQRLRASAVHGHVHPHPHSHEHHHSDTDDNEQGHSHSSHAHLHSEKGKSGWGVVWLGVAGGLAPCPGALWIYFLALGFGRPALAVLLILALSLGLAAVLVSVGLVTLSLGGMFNGAADGEKSPLSRPRFISALYRAGSKAICWAPVAAGCLLVLTGCFMVWNGLAGLGISAMFK